MNNRVKMRIAVICPSEIAYRRFLPSLKTINEAILVGVGVNNLEERYGSNLPSDAEITNMFKSEYDKANKMISEYGGRIYDSYEKVITDPDIDAIYIPLPPALHYKWAKRALECGKHVLVEKPSTTAYSDSNELVELAKRKELAIHENYMFVYHNQLDAIDAIIQSGEIGDVRLYRIDFGFPRRSVNDFRYNKLLGGGALIDAGGYTIKYATRLLGPTAEIKCAHLNYINEFDVDIYGSATLINKFGATAQISFGIDNDYKCDLEVWGSKGTLKTCRVLTAPVGLYPSLSIKKNTEIEQRALPTDDAFKKSIEHFIKCINDKNTRENNYESIIKQAYLIDKFYELANVII